jgi:hypothetical protein
MTSLGCFRPGRGPAVVKRRRVSQEFGTNRIPGAEEDWVEPLASSAEQAPRTRSHSLSRWTTSSSTCHGTSPSCCGLGKRKCARPVTCDRHCSPAWNVEPPPARCGQLASGAPTSPVGTRIKERAVGGRDRGRAGGAIGRGLGRLGQGCRRYARHGEGQLVTRCGKGAFLDQPASGGGEVLGDGAESLRDGCAGDRRAGCLELGDGA